MGAAAVDLIPAGEVEPDALGEDLADQIDGQLPLGAEGQARRQPHDPPLRRVLEVLARDPLPGGDQRMAEFAGCRGIRLITRSGRYHVA